MDSHWQQVEALAALRVRIAELKREEATLRTLFLDIASQRPCTGLRHEVIVRRTNRRQFQRDRLPSALLADPSLWATQVQRRVCVRARPQPERTLPAAADNGDCLIEPFHPWNPGSPLARGQGAV